MELQEKEKTPVEKVEDLMWDLMQRSGMIGWRRDEDRPHDISIA